MPDGPMTAAAHVPGVDATLTTPGTGEGPSTKTSARRDRAAAAPAPRRGTMLAPLRPGARRRAPRERPSGRERRSSASPRPNSTPPRSSPPEIVPTMEVTASRPLGAFDAAPLAVDHQARERDDAGQRDERRHRERDRPRVQTAPQRHWGRAEVEGLVHPRVLGVPIGAGRPGVKDPQARGRLPGRRFPRAVRPSNR